MKIEILGTRANIKVTHPHHNKHTGILIDGKILIDVGEQIYLERNPEYIFITHLHDDHASFVHGKLKTGSRLIAVFAPEKHHNLAQIKIPPAFQAIHAGEYSVTAVPVYHSARVKSFAYVIEKKEKRIFYTGDISSADHKWIERYGRFDMIIIDGSHFRKGGHIQIDKISGKLYGHTGIPDQVEVFRKFTDHIVVVHLGSWFVREAENGETQIRSLSAGKLIVEPATDGQVFKI